MTRNASANYFAEAIELPVSAEAKSWARAWADMHLRIPHRETLFNRHWSAYECNLYGRLAEAAFAEWLGVAHLLPPPQPRHSDGGLDLPGIDVKCSPWLLAVKMFERNGGHMWAMVSGLVAERFPRCSYFTQGARLHFDGWATAAMMRAAPVIRSGPAAAYQIAYADLLLPADFAREVAAL